LIILFTNTFTYLPKVHLESKLMIFLCFRLLRLVLLVRWEDLELLDTPLSQRKMTMTRMWMSLELRPRYF